MDFSSRPQVGKGRQMYFSVVPRWGKVAKLIF